jgi:hypothetical protein
MAGPYGESSPEQRAFGPLRVSQVPTLGSSEVLFVLAAMLVTRWGLDAAAGPSDLWRRAGVFNRDRFCVGHLRDPTDRPGVLVVSHCSGRHGGPVILREGSVAVCASCVLDGLVEGVDLGARSVDVLAGLVAEVSVGSPSAPVFEVALAALEPFVAEALCFRDGDGGRRS